MRNAIAVMNTKGGVGKSTLVLALAETLSAHYGKNVLIIDSDAQTSISSMLLTPANLHRLQSEGLTIVDLLVASVLNNVSVDWPRFVVGGVSDVDEARSVYLVPSDMQLTLFEREVSKENLHGQLRISIGALLQHVRGVFDIVLVDCPPGLSVLTELWLREADFHVSPTKPDYVSTCGLEVFRRFKGLNPEMGFAENLGVIVNMKDAYSTVDADYQRWLTENADNRCFTQAVPRTSALQVAAQLSAVERSYVAKYPGDFGPSHSRRGRGADRSAQGGQCRGRSAATTGGCRQGRPATASGRQRQPSAAEACPGRAGRGHARLTSATNAGGPTGGEPGSTVPAGGGPATRARDAALPGARRARTTRQPARGARGAGAKQGQHPPAATAAKQADADQVRAVQFC